MLFRSPGKVTADRMNFDGIDLLNISPRERRRLVGKDIAMVFQEPMSSLNPCFTIGWQIAEALKTHLDLPRAEVKARVIELLNQTGIPAPETRLSSFPHQLSGGMNQRVMIAMAIACNPRLLIADEPTTALDVTIQAQILDLLRRLRDETGTAIILITHDLGVIAELADEVVVMYAGRVVERAPVGRLFAEPQHPYTIGLLGAVARLDRPVERLAVIAGTVPSPHRAPPGCRFNPRCPFAVERCRVEAPPLARFGPDHWAACWQAPLGAAA